MPLLRRTSSADPVSGATMPPMSDTIRPPKNVNSSHAPKPISAEVAARRTATDSSIPNASHSDTYTKVSSSHSTIRRISARFRHDAEADDPEGRDHADDGDEHQPDDGQPADELAVDDVVAVDRLGQEPRQRALARSPLIASNAKASPSNGAT